MFLLRFYEELSSLSNEPVPVADACRRAQLWLRDTAVREMVQYVKRTRLPEKTKLALVTDIERFGALASRGAVGRELICKLLLSKSRFFNDVLIVLNI